MSSFHDTEETTQNQRGTLSSRNLRAALPSEPPALEGSELELLGRALASSARTDRKVENLTTEVRTLSTEVSQLRKDLEEDRGALVHGASRSSAKHTANRMAGLLGTLFLLSELAAPCLRELYRLVHH